MAPFNTHFLIAEKIWPAVKAMTAWPEPDNEIYYDQFCFGCVAPDVDKVSSRLTQKDTHFFDRAGPYELMASHRSAAFIQQQADFLCQPFAQLNPAAQAFILGFLCHLCVDEVSKLMWQRDTWIQFKDIGPGAAFASLDEVARQRIQDYPKIVQALNSIEVLDIIPQILEAELEIVLQGVTNFVQAQSIEDEYLALVDMFDKPTPAEQEGKRRKFRATIDIARQQVGLFRLDTLVEAGLKRSRQRLGELINGCTPEPGLPVLD